MNRNRLVSHVAAETSVTKATPDSLVRAVFSAIADALARDETVAIAGYGKFAVRSRSARTGCNPQTGEPFAIAASKVASFQPAKALRDAINEWRGGTGPVPALVPAGLAGAERTRTGVESRSPRSGMFVAGRGRGDFADSSLVRTSAQSRAEIESPRARVPYYGPMRIFSNDSVARRYAPVEANALPGRLRRWRAHSPTPHATTAREYRPHELFAVHSRHHAAANTRSCAAPRHAIHLTEDGNSL